VPQSFDPRLRIELFVVAPDIVHPIGIAFDQRGRLLVIESLFFVTVPLVLNVYLLF
jgi:hypothetical protein